MNGLQSTTWHASTSRPVALRSARTENFNNLLVPINVRAHKPVSKYYYKYLIKILFFESGEARNRYQGNSISRAINSGTASRSRMRCVVAPSTMTSAARGRVL